MFMKMISECGYIVLSDVFLNCVQAENNASMCERMEKKSLTDRQQVIEHARRPALDQIKMEYADFIPYKPLKQMLDKHL